MRLHRRAVIACLVASALGIVTAQGGVRVDATSLLGPVGPYVYGVNYGHLSAVPVNLFDEAAAAGITFIRYPGGSVADQGDLKPFDIDMLMTMSKLLGAEPSIQVRLPGGSPQAAADLVRYVNVEMGYDVRHWYIGNEPSLYDDYDVATLNREWRAIAEAMLAVDPDLVLIGPEPHQWTGLPGSTILDRDGVEWVEGFLQANGDLVDVVAVHRYPFPRSTGDPGTTVADLRENAAEWTHLITRLRTLAESVTGREDLLFAVSEANSHWSRTAYGEATNDSRMNAVWWADVLGKLIVDGAYMVGFFDLQSSDARGSWGLLSNNEPRPTYYTYVLYSRFGEDLVAATSDVPYVSAYAALREDGALTVIVTNLSDEPVETTFIVTAGYEPAAALLLDDTHDAAEVPLPLAADGGAITLPPRSATLLELLPTAAAGLPAPDQP